MNISKFFLLAAALLCVSRPAQATLVVAADLEELSHDARTIVRGRVVALDARWTDDRRRVETLVTIEAESYLKGALGAMVQFRVPGGQLGRYRSIFVGAPTFVPGQRVVVFLGVRGPSIPYVLGLNQGVFHVEPGGNGWTVRSQPLADFERQVRVLAGGTR